MERKKGKRKKRNKEAKETDMIIVQYRTVGTQLVIVKLFLPLIWNIFIKQKYYNYVEQKEV